MHFFGPREENGFSSVYRDPKLFGLPLFCGENALFSPLKLLGIRVRPRR